MADHPELSFIEKDGQLFACICAASERPPLDLDALRELLVQADYVTWPLTQTHVEVREEYGSNRAWPATLIQASANMRLKLELAVRRTERGTRKPIETSEYMSRASLKIVG